MADRLVLASVSVFVFLAIIGIISMMNPKSDAVPPTNAFSKVNAGVGTIEAKSYDSTLILTNGSGISFSVSNGLHISQSPTPYAQISSLQTQACAAAGAASNVTLNSNDGIYKITHSTSTRPHEITVQETGTYMIMAAPQVGEAVVQADGLHNFWMMKNGAQVANTNVKSHVLVQIGGDETVMEMFSWVGRLNQNDIIYFQQSCTDADIGIIFTAAAVPRIRRLSLYPLQKQETDTITHN